ncbi:MAG: haloacid dehalogenase-like hydrolase [Egibacteraceae bacterium]
MREHHGPLQAAFFDLDHTVVASASTLAFGRSLYREGLISPSVAVKVAYAQLALGRLGVTEARMERARAAVLELTRGWEAERITRLVRATLHEVVDPLVYAEARELLALHRQASRARPAQPRGSRARFLRI